MSFSSALQDQGTPQCPGPLCSCNNATDYCQDEPVDLFISIGDIQDTPPVFERLPYIGNIREDALVVGDVSFSSLFLFLFGTILTLLPIISLEIVYGT